jgi:SAM-dependent methyltransferase
VSTGSIAAPPPPPSVPDYAAAADVMRQRRELLLADVRPEEQGLEIGPLANPLVRRSEGYDIAYADYAPAEELRAKSAADPNVDIDAIPEVDHVVRQLSDYRPLKGRFDYVIASHVIEHVPDLVGWLRAVVSTLRPTGRLILAIPDRRYTFDYLRPTSTLGEVLESFDAAAPRPNLRQVIDANDFARHVNVLSAWDGGLDLDARIFTRDQIRALRDRWHAGDYIDAHCWVFTADSFPVLCETLVSLGLLDCGIRSLTPPQRYWNEFHAVLERRPGSGRS